MRLERVLAAVHDSTDCMEITCDDREFEHALGVLFEHMGYSVEVTKATGDGGIDLNVYKRASFWVRRRRHYIIQAKHWQNGVGSPEIHRLYGTLMHVRAEGAILITSGYFTKGTVAFAEGKPIELIDGVALRVLIERYGLHHEFSVNASFPNTDLSTSSVSPRLRGLFAIIALIMFCVAVGWLNSIYHHSEESFGSTAVAAQKQPSEAPQPTSTPMPEKAATEQLSTPSVPKVAEAPASPSKKVPIEPQASPYAQAMALQKYPELGVAGSPFNRVFILRFQRYQTEKPDFFTDPEWPTKLADEVAKVAGGALRQPLPSVRPPNR